MKPFTIEFDAPDVTRFPLVQRAFNALKVAKASPEGIDDEVRDPVWLDYFDDSARRFFLWTDECVGKPDGPRWGTSGWYFWSMIHMIGCCDYDLIHCELLNESKAEMGFDPHGYPFGGTASLRVLGECFGLIGTKEWDDKPFPTWEEIEEAYRKFGK